MPDILSVSGASFVINFGMNFGVARSRIGFAKMAGLALALLMLTACDRTANPNETINLKLYQNWQLQPGDKVAGFPVVSGLGDVSIELNGKSVYAPFEGQAQKDQRNCLIFLALMCLLICFGYVAFLTRDWATPIRETL